jgi:hypothetical protein
VKLFELDDRPVVSLNLNEAIVFDQGAWRQASIHTARTVLVDGSEMTPTEFARTFPDAARSLPNGN